VYQIVAGRLDHVVDDRAAFLGQLDGNSFHRLVAAFRRDSAWFLSPYSSLLLSLSDTYPNMAL
jgi:hypothetical protein